MAEVVGTIAAAAQLAEVALKLRRLWAEIQESPKTIHDLVEETASTAELLSDIQKLDLESSSLMLDHNGWKLCHQRFDMAAKSLKELVDHVATTIKTHRRTGRIRVFVQKDELLRCRDRLERTKSNLLLAEVTLTRATLAQNSRLLQEVHASAAQLSTSLANVHSISQDLSASIPMSFDKTIPEQAKHGSAFAIQRKNYLGRAKTTRTTNRQFQLPQWICSRALQLIVDRNNSSWGITVRVYSRLGPGAEVFRAAFNDDWTTVQRMFSCGQASPFDIAEDGLTLLHAAAYKGNAYACRLLLDFGHDCVARQHNSGRTPLDFFAIGDNASGGTKSSRSDRLEVTRLLAEGFEDAILKDQIENSMLFELPADAIDIMIQSASPSYAYLAPEIRAKIAMTATSSECLHLMLGPNLTFIEALSLIDNTNRMPLLLTITRLLAKIVEDDEATIAFTAEWKPIVSTLLYFENQNKNFDYSRSYLKNFVWLYLRNYGWSERASSRKMSWTAYLTYIACLWIRWLLATGINLDHYAQLEKRYFLVSHPSAYITPAGFTKSTNRATISGDWARICGLSSGPELDDWSLYAVPAHILKNKRTPFGGFLRELEGNPEYEMAGQFWRWIERPEDLFIPGAWEIDEAEEYYNSGKDVIGFIEFV